MKLDALLLGFRPAKIMFGEKPTVDAVFYLRVGNSEVHESSGSSGRQITGKPRRACSAVARDLHRPPQPQLARGYRPRGNEARFSLLPSWAPFPFSWKTLNKYVLIWFCLLKIFHVWVPEILV